MRQELGDASHVVAQALLDPLDRHWRPHPGLVTVDPVREVDTRRQDRSARAQRERRRPRGHRGPLAEELDLGAATLQITIGQQTHHVVVAQCSHHRLAGVGPERHHLHTERRAQVDEPVEQLGRLDLLDDDGDLVALVDDPSAGPLPAAEMRQHQDHAVALVERFDDVLIAVDVETLARPRRPTGWAAGNSRASSGRRNRTPPAPPDAAAGPAVSGRHAGGAARSSLAAQGWRSSLRVRPG